MSLWLGIGGGKQLNKDSVSGRGRKGLLVSGKRKREIRRHLNILDLDKNKHLIEFLHINKNKHI